MIHYSLKNHLSATNVYTQLNIVKENIKILKSVLSLGTSISTNYYEKLKIGEELNIQKSILKSIKVKIVEHELRNQKVINFNI